MQFWLGKASPYLHCVSLGDNLKTDIELLSPN